MSGILHVAAVALALVAASLTLASAVGVAAMRDPYQRLHFVAPPATLAASLVALALWLDGAGPSAGVQGTLSALLLAAMTGVLGHASARAFFVREHGGWPPRPEVHLEPGPGGPDRALRGGGETAP